MMRLIIGSVGSSPLTRGTLTITTEQDETVSVHPRLRGELILIDAHVAERAGSSPLTRGTHLKWLQHYTNRLTAKLLKNISKQEQSY